jgi:NAD(P)-dependent dehydrogenase (short-subunit alcohol dehydrogenase family)
MSKILITGASSGLGKALYAALGDYSHEVRDYSLAIGKDVLKPNLLDIPELDILINCAGVNEINWLPDVSEAEWDRVIDTNLKGIFMMTQACLPMLKASKGTVVNIVSNAAHMPMRCSAANNASKGGALILTKQLARELSPDITVFSVSPNKLAGTGMSKHIDARVTRTRGWTEEQAAKYQLASLLPGEETPPEVLAEFIAFLLSNKRRHKYLTGCDLQYGA